MQNKIYLAAGVLLIGGLCHAAPRIDTALWLARSCVGEAGFSSVETRECASIAYVYHKRNLMARHRSYFQVLRGYSAAVRESRAHRGWIRQLNRKGDRPPMMATNVNWAKQRGKWFKTIKMADAFFRGRILDPTPEAIHFGGDMDIHILNWDHWEALDTPGFGNTFYRRVGI